ncbi:hypothetical protein ACGC1H_002234 [Rhizoctonia solani]
MSKHNLNAGLPILFRSYTVATNPGPDSTIWQASYATMAHPDLFKSIDIVVSSVSQSFVGGELGCSNPIAHVLSEVKRVYPDRQVACIISIGAGHARTIQVPSPSRWRRTQDVIVMKDMATDSERVAEEMVARFEGTSGVYFRFNVDQGLQDMKDGSWERLGETMQHTNAYLQKGETNQKLEDVVRASMERRGVVPAAHVAGKISSVVEVPTWVTGFKRCPAPTKFYTGYEDKNAQVIACITGEKSKLCVCVIYGLGGVGKTQLALSVVERTWEEWDYIIYVDASSAEAIEKTLEDFGAAKSVGQGHKDVISWLGSCGERWLVVFDNADTPSTDIQQYIPARSEGGSVIITTRLPDLANLADGPGCVCHLSSMSLADGTALLVKIASSRNQRLTDNDTKAANELVQEFGCLALAIVHAGAYIAHSPGMIITEYLSLFLSQRRRMLEEYNKLPVTAKLDKRGDTVYTTWKMCYDQLKPESCELLWLIAYLHYDGISGDIFKRAAQNMHSHTYPLPLTDLESQAQNHVKQYLSTFLDCDGKWDTIKFTRVMADLTSYSLIDFDRMNLTYRMHVLVHDWAKTVVPRSPELGIKCTAALLLLSIDWKEDAESLAFKRRLGLHTTSVLTHSPDIGANYSFYFKEVYHHAGKWSQVLKLVQHVVGAFQEQLGDDHLKTWQAVGYLGHTYLYLGRYDKAEQQLVQAVDAYKRILGEEHRNTLTSMGNLASTYSHLGRYNEANQLQVQVLDACKRILGEEHPHTLISVGKLASTYLCLGRHDEAKQLLVQVLDACKRILGEEHPHTLTSMNNLASTYSHLGRYNEAKQLLVQAVDAYKRILGEEHPHTLTSMSSLALTYSHLGRYNEAKQLLVQVLDACKRILGEEHPHTLTSMNKLASTYSHLGRYNEAEQLQVHAVDTYKRILGEEHPETLTSMSGLALTYSDLGRYNKAEQLLVQVLDANKQILGEEHPETLNSMNNLASTYSHLGRYNEAEQLEVQVLDARKRILGEDHPETLTSMNNLASTYSHLGRYNEAEQLHLQVLQIRNQILGEEHPDTLTSTAHLALICSNLGRWDESEELHNKVISLAQKIRGEHHPITQLYRENYIDMQNRRQLDMGNNHSKHHKSLLAARFFKFF